MESTGAWSPWWFVGLFLAASFVTIWRLESMSAGGMEGTVLGTLVTPYITGLGNLIFAYVLGKKGGPAVEVMKNCLVNNVTNMTLILGLPAIFWSLNVLPRKKNGGKKPAKKGANPHELNRLSLLLTIAAEKNGQKGRHPPGNQPPVTAPDAGRGLVLYRNHLGAGRRRQA